MNLVDDNRTEAGGITVVHFSSNQVTVGCGLVMNVVDEICDCGKGFH